MQLFRTNLMDNGLPTPKAPPSETAPATPLPTRSLKSCAPYKNHSFWSLSLLLPFFLIAAAPDPNAVQIPPAVKSELETTEERFRSVLEEECPQGCFPVGCKASRFVVQDQTQNASLPGLEESKIQPTPQYKLVSLLCEFAVEPKIEGEELANIKQRVRQKVKSVGVELTLGTRPLTPKVDVNMKKDPPVQESPPAPPPTLGEQLALKLIPFVPWFLTLCLATISILLLLWGWRKLGRTERRSPLARTRSTDLQPPLSTAGVEGEEAEPTPHMLSQRLGELAQSLAADRRLLEVTLKKYFDEENFPELVLFIRHFGPDLLAPFKEKPEYREALSTLSDTYAQSPTSDTPGAVWAFLDRIEREMTAAKVRIDAEPLADNFLFLASVGVDEFIGVLRELTDEEAIVAVSYAPRKLREQFFASASPTFTNKFVEHLSQVEKMPDAFVRTVAKKLRETHQQKGESLRLVRRDTVPLFEEAINALEPDKRRQLLHNLARVNPDFLRTVAPVVFLDDALPLLTNAMLEETLMLVSPDEAAHYLAPFPWAKDLLGRINPRLAEAILKKTPGASGESELAFQAREKIAQFIKKQHLQGNIDLTLLNTRLMKDDLLP